MDRLSIRIKTLISNEEIYNDKDLALEYLNDDLVLYKDIMKTFVKSSAEDIKCLKLGIELKDFKLIRNIIHKIKGYSYYIGNKDLYDYGNYLCTLLVKKRFLGIKRKVKIFIDYFMLVVDYKKRELNNV